MKDCKYRLPCVWCDKYDRQCLLVEYEAAKQEREKNSKPKECEHDWVFYESRTHTGGTDVYYKCYKCGAIKLVCNDVTYESGEWQP